MLSRLTLSATTLAAATGSLGSQQFHDFLVMIDRADLLDDEQLASALGRQARYDEFTAIVVSPTMLARELPGSIAIGCTRSVRRFD